MHLTTIYTHARESHVDLLDCLFLAREDDDAFEVALMEDVFDDAELLRLMTDIGALLDFLSGLAHGEFNCDGVFQQVVRQFLDLVRHRC